MQFRTFTLFTTGLFIFTGFVDLRAQSDTPPRKAIAIPTSQPPDIDGKVDAVWRQAVENKGFIQREPSQGEPATNDTRFYILYDRENIYFLFVMLDRDYRSIPARLVDRDYRFYPDDSINFYLDTYNDSRKAFYFSSNPLGVKQDGLVSENGDNVDMNWDCIFRLEARINPYGWVAEYAIPFKSLRFKDGEKFQTWGINVWRIRKKSREISYWALVDRNYQMFRLDKGGLLEGMKNVKGGHHINVLPYLTSRNITDKTSSGEFDFNQGLDLKLSLTSDLTLDFTLNPDFGQVEIDEEQINLDKRFEIQLEEKRPFFQENSPLFQTPFYQLFYSRRIGYQSNIKYGAKLTGKMGPYSVGVLETQTGDWDNYGLGDPDNQTTDELFSVIRVQRDILESSNIGATFVDREANLGGNESYANRAGGLDWNLYVGQKYFIGQAVYSQNTRNNKKGGAAYGQVGYYGKFASLDVHASYYEPEFDIDSTGFFQKLPGKGRKQTGLYADIHPLINTKLIRSWGLSTQPLVMQDSDESNPGWGVENKLWIETPDQSRVKIGYTRYVDVERDQYYRRFDRTSPTEFTYWGTDMFAEIESDPGKMFSVSLRWNMDSQYYFQTHSSGFNRGLEGQLLFKPLSNAFLQFEYKRREFLDDDLNPLPTNKIGQSDVRIQALRVRYLFSKTIFSRGFLQKTNAAEKLVRGEQGYEYEVWDRLSANILLGWRFKPGSTLYLAYTEELANLNRDSFQSTNRIFFFKLSYLWSL